MGNSLSKNDISNNGMTAGATGASLVAELDSEEKVALSRQRHLTNEFNEFRNERRDTSNTENEGDEQEPEPKHTSIEISNRRGSTALHEDHLYKNIKVILNSTSSSPRRTKKLHLKDRMSELDLEIGLASARSMQIVDSSSGNDNFDNSSSSSSSPIFTMNGKDDDILSVTSVGSPDQSGTELPKDVKEILGPIEEFDEDLEPPRPGKLRSKSRSRSSSSSDVIPKIINSDSSSSSVVEGKNSPPNEKEIDIDAIIEKLLLAGLRQRRRWNNREKLSLSGPEIKSILHRARSIFLTQPTLLRLSPPVKIVGDIHGQYEDLLRIFNICGYPPNSNYLFLGDYVDRGNKSLETFLLLMCYKIKYPENFFMLRGNHESANVTKIYGFYDECKRRLPQRKMWKDFVDVFNSLPLAAIISDKIFCVHGGLSPDLHNLSQIENLRRPTDVPDRGLLADLLWSDPDPKIRGSNWTKNDRGVSYCFGKKHVDYFCSRFKIDLIVRGHMVVEDGYEFFDHRKLVTVFSAPNYCGEFNNFGSVMSVDKRLCCSFELIKPRAG